MKYEGPERDNLTEDFKKILRKIKQWCVYRDRCISEVKQKLLVMKVSDSNTERITELLIKENYINEERYCESYVNGKFHSRKWGRQRIRAVLNMKGLPAVIIENKLAEIDNNEYMSVLENLVMHKLKSLSDENDKMVQAKVIKFVRFKGFETNLALEILNQHKNKH